MQGTTNKYAISKDPWRDNQSKLRTSPNDHGFWWILCRVRSKFGPIESWMNCSIWPSFIPSGESLRDPKDVELSTGADVFKCVPGTSGRSYVLKIRQQQGSAGFQKEVCFKCFNIIPACGGLGTKRWYHQLMPGKRQTSKKSSQKAAERNKKRPVPTGRQCRRVGRWHIQPWQGQNDGSEVAKAQRKPFASCDLRSCGIWRLFVTISNTSKSFDEQNVICEVNISIFSYQKTIRR